MNTNFIKPSTGLFTLFAIVVCIWDFHSFTAGFNASAAITGWTVDYRARKGW
jgi:hypothetical protein